MAKKKSKRAKELENNAPESVEASENEVQENVSGLARAALASLASFESNEEASPEAEAASEDVELAVEESDLDLEVSDESDDSSDELEMFAVNVEDDPNEIGFLPEATDEASFVEEDESAVEDVSGSELDAYESADIEDVEFVEDERLDSIVESILFASDRPVSLNQIKMVFKGTNVKSDKIRRALDRLAVELAGARRGVSLEEVPGGYQIRTKVDNMQFLTRTLKARPFKLSGPALEVLAIAAYKQPIIKSEIDEIRGVESGHLLRALMEKGLVNFEGKSDLPGKPMQYATTKKFLEIFGLRNLKELPTLSQIDELLPEGIDEISAEKPTLSQLTDSLSQEVMSTYSEGEDELLKISEQLQDITTSSDFFEQEKLRQKQKRDSDRAQSLREAILVGEEVSNRDRNWLNRYDEALQAGNTAALAKEELIEAGELKPADAAAEVVAKVEAFESDADIESASFDEAPADDEELAVPYHDEEDEDAEA